MSESKRVLLVDDEQLVLEALRRQHGQHFALVTATSPAAALARIDAGEAFAVVVSDFQMPEMDGVQFLERMRSVAPHTVRVMLTGQADVNVATRAVNRGAIYRFLTKPCSNVEFAGALSDALEHHRVLAAERRLLEETLAGSVRVLCEVLALANHEAFGRAGRVRELAHTAALALCPAEVWVVDTAATLFPIGLIAVPPDLIASANAGAPLEAGEREVMARVPVTGANLLQGVPRLEPVAEILRHQGERFDAEHTPLGARILSAAIALDELLHRGIHRKDALATLRAQPGRFDPLVLDHLGGAETSAVESERRVLSVHQLAVGMVLDQDVVNSAGAVVVPRGHLLSPALVARLRNHFDLGMVREPIRVLARPQRNAPSHTPIPVS